MKDAKTIFRFLLDAAADGQATALITLTDVIGSSPRAAGTHMAVSENGASAGSFSGGCIEAAVVGEAMRVIASGTTESVRFGAGSPFLDIRLPCGGGVNLLIVPRPAKKAIEAAWSALARRQSVSLRMNAAGMLTADTQGNATASGWLGDTFVANHAPDLRLVVIGHGAEVAALTKLGKAYGTEIVVLTPDEAIAREARALGAETHQLKTPRLSPHLRTDRETAVIFLFHDHDWEGELLEQALNQETLFIGAMGSRQTQAIRVASLIERGVSEADANRVTGPIGLIAATRDPETLALAVLAQIAERSQQRRKAAH
jgi:xanthine dehydrogenase accessory factor